MANDGGGASLEYGKAGSVVRRFGGLGSKDGGANVGGAVHAHAEITMMRVMAKKVAAGVLGACSRAACCNCRGRDGRR